MRKTPIREALPKEIAGRGSLYYRDLPSDLLDEVCAALNERYCLWIARVGSG